MTGYGFSTKAKRQPHKFCVAAFFDVRLTTRSGFLRVLLWHLNITQKDGRSGRVLGSIFSKPRSACNKIVAECRNFVVNGSNGIIPEEAGIH